MSARQRIEVDRLTIVGVPHTASGARGSAAREPALQKLLVRTSRRYPLKSQLAPQSSYGSNKRR